MDEILLMKLLEGINEISPDKKYRIEKKKLFLDLPKDEFSKEIVHIDDIIEIYIIPTNKVQISVMDKRERLDYSGISDMHPAGFMKTRVSESTLTLCE